MSVFWASEVKVNEAAAFQLSLTAPTNVTISSLPITSLAVYFSDDIFPVVVRHSQSDSGSHGRVRKVDLGHVSTHSAGKEPESKGDIQAHLRWQPGATIIFSGTMSADIPTVLKVPTLD